DFLPADHRHVSYKAEAVRIHDARPDLAAGQVSLAENGVTLVRHPTSLCTEEFYSLSTRAREVYFREVCAAVTEATGAQEVVAFHHLVRNEAMALKLAGGDPSIMAGYDNSLGGVGGYAPNAHADYTPATAAGTARQQLQRLLEERSPKTTFGRYVLINAWRSISDSGPVLNHPLAVLDGASLSSEDRVTVDLHYRSFVSESMQLRCSQPHSRHRWLYFPRMVKDEILLFKQYDSDPTEKVCYAFHCAFS
ncbi:unnamed protein product, partial [Polarella glacialis]